MSGNGYRISIDRRSGRYEKGGHTFGLQPPTSWRSSGGEVGKDRDLMEGVGYAGGTQSGAMLCNILNLGFSDPVTTQRPLASEQQAHAAAGFSSSLSSSPAVVIGNQGLGGRGLRNSPRMRWTDR